MPPGQDNLAIKVLALLNSANLVRDNEDLQQAADLARTVAQATLAELTPKFEAYFAIATLITSLRHREDRDSIDRRFTHALSLTKKWADAGSNNGSKIEQKGRG
ncbi:MAG: hypothetical protein ACREEK_00550 [Bradyrhizobium sp.]